MDEPTDTTTQDPATTTSEPGDPSTSTSPPETDGDPPSLAGADARFDASAFSKEAQALVGAKKFETVGHLADALANQEKLIGQKRIGAPEAGNLKDWLGENAQVLGVPENAADYAMPDVELAEGQEFDQELLKRGQEFAKSINMPQEMFAAWAEFQANEQKALFEEVSAAAALADEQTEQELRKSWGRDYDANVETALLAARHLGMDEETLQTLEGGLGSAALVKHFHMLGTMIDEAALEAGDGVGMREGAAAAQAEIEQLKADASFAAKLKDKASVGHKEALAKWTKLHEQAASAP